MKKINILSKNLEFSYLCDVFQDKFDLLFFLQEVKILLSQSRNLYYSINF